MDIVPDYLSWYALLSIPGSSYVLLKRMIQFYEFLIFYESKIIKQNSHFSFMRNASYVSEITNDFEKIYLNGD